jgi:hypothetical protein
MDQVFVSDLSIFCNFSLSSAFAGPYRQGFLGTTELEHGWLDLLVLPDWLSPRTYVSHNVVVGHRRRYDRVLLRTQLITAGLEICAMRYWGIMLLPIALVRKLYLKSMKNLNDIARAGFQPPGSLSAYLLSTLEIVERAVFRYQPVGTSLLAIARKIH